MITTIIKKIKTNTLLNEIISVSNNTDILLVGGCVRDFFLNKDNFDKDLIILNQDAEAFSEFLAEKLNATFIPLDEGNKIYRLVLSDKKNFIDITNPLENSVEKDLARRDFTMNAVAINLKTFEVHDLFNGLSDLKNGIIKLISEQNIIDDPLRLLRAYRFQAVTGFDIDKTDENLIKKHTNLIKTCAKERITYEIMKLFNGKNFYTALENSDKVNLLTQLFPVMNDVKKVPSNTHHHLTLFYHSLTVSKNIEKLYEEAPEKIKLHLEKQDFGGFSRLTHLKLAGFLHDIGKFSTWTIEKETGRHRFFKHEDVGAKMSISILKTMKFSKKQIDYISTMIKNHLYPSQIISDPNVNEKLYLRYIRKIQDNVIDNIYLAMADRLSARGKAVSDDMVTKNINELTKLLEFYLSIKDTLKPLPKLLSGKEIIELTNILPSKKLGEIIDLLYEAQLNSKVSTKKEAVSFIKNLTTYKPENPN